MSDKEQKTYNREWNWFMATSLTAAFSVAAIGGLLADTVVCDNHIETLGGTKIFDSSRAGGEPSYAEAEFRRTVQRQTLEGHIACWTIGLAFIAGMEAFASRKRLEEYPRPAL